MKPIDQPPSFLPIAPGVELGVLRRHLGGGMTFLVRMQEGARAPHHDHPGGEETYVLSGKLRIESRRASGRAEPDVELAAGDYFFAPAGETHDGIAVEPHTLFFVVAPGGVAPTSTRSNG
jgi:quercetin dioxygenase-like cupin family protein